MKDQHQKQYAGVLIKSPSGHIYHSVKEGEFAIQDDRIIAGEYHGDKGQHAYNNAEKTDNRKYFKTISHHLLPFDEIFIFGPGKSRKKLLNFLCMKTITSRVRRSPLVVLKK